MQAGGSDKLPRQVSVRAEGAVSSPVLTVFALTRAVSPNLLTERCDHKHPVEVPFLGIPDQVIRGCALARVLQLPPPQVCFTKQTKHAEFPMDLTVKDSVLGSGQTCG